MIRIDPGTDIPVYLQITNALFTTSGLDGLRKGLKLPEAAR